MLICYLDKSGNTGRRLDDPEQPIHLIAAVMIVEDRVREMTDLLDALTQRAPTRQPLIEYHGSQLYGGSGPWLGVPPSQRIDAYAEALSVVGRVEAGIAYASVNKPALALRDYEDPNPHTIALQFLTEKIERWLKRQQYVLSRRALLVADKNHEQEQYSLDLIREMRAAGGPVGSGHGISIPLDHVVDNIYFDRSDRNRGIQLADLVAFVLNRYLRIQRSPFRTRSDAAIRRLFYEYIEPSRRTWREPWPGRPYTPPGPATDPGDGWTDAPR